MVDTTTHGYMFPEAADPLAVVNENIQALAEFLDHYATVSVTSLSVPNGGAGIQWSAFLGSDHFALGTQYAANDVLVYDGPGRFYAWCLDIRWPAQVTGTRDHLLEVNPASPSWVALDETVGLASPSNTKFHRAGIMPLQNGDKVWLRGGQSSGGAQSFDGSLILAAL